jgi:hypothetical protein
MAGDGETVLARLDPSQGRRWVGVVVQVALGVTLISLAFGLPREQMLMRLVLLVLGGVVILGAYLTWKATQSGLILTQAGLLDGQGRLLAEMSNIREVARGPFALKPSHGFSLILQEGMEFAWVPGLWWRLGRRVGVGGVTPSQPARFMAEMISGMVAARDG